MPAQQQQNNRQRINHWIFWLFILASLLTSITWTLKGRIDDLAILRCGGPDVEPPACYPPDACMICKINGQCKTYPREWCWVLRTLQVKTLGEDGRPFLLNSTSLGLEKEKERMVGGAWRKISIGTLCIVPPGTEWMSYMWFCYKIMAE